MGVQGGSAPVTGKPSLGTRVKRRLGRNHSRLVRCSQLSRLAGCGTVDSRMLHGALPRAYLPPGLSYFGGYYGEDFAPYPQLPAFVSVDDYSRIGQDQRILPSWKALGTTLPLPLDLSVKPQVSCSSTASSPRAEESETIEVDDEEDRKDRVQRRLDSRGLNREEQMDEDQLSHLSYPDPRKYQLPTPKMTLTSPTRIAAYHQQFLLTPPQNLQAIHAPMTPPSTPSPPQCPKRRPTRDEEPGSPPDGRPAKQIQTVEKITKAKKKHVARRLKFDEDTSSPVSGTVILGPDEAVVTGDIDPAFNVVEVTEEARAEIAKIENRLGPYQCKLCRSLYDDAFQLAQHRCSRIAHVEYRCPECDKRFSCPANLASHRRWHKPRVTTEGVAQPTNQGEIPCPKCDAKFSRQTALKKHLSVQHAENNNNESARGGEEEKMAQLIASADCAIESA